MVSSKTSKMISLAISLLAVVISLTGIASAATAPTVSTLTRYAPGLAGIPGKMARDAAGNFYVTDFWAKGIVKLDRQGGRIGFIPTAGHPAAVAVMPDSRLVVAFNTPQAKVAFYSQSGSAPNVTGQEITSSPFGAPASPLYKPAGIAVDAAGFIYVVDSGDLSASATANVPRVRVFSSTGQYLYAFGARTPLATPYYDTVNLRDGEFSQPMGIAYEATSNQIVVADTLNGRLQFFSAWNGSSCSFVKKIGITAGQDGGAVAVGGIVRFGSPTDIAFEYAAGVLDRIYVTERSRHEVDCIDAAGTIDLKRISGSTVTGAAMRYPSGLFFEKTTTGGVLYVNSAATTGAADILALAIDGGSVPVPPVTLLISSVAPTVTSATLPLSGTVSPVYGVSCSVNGGSFQAATPSGSAWNTDLTLASGDNYILCKASNGTITTYAEANTYFTGATTPAPVVTILSPSAGLYTKNADVTVSGTTDSANVSLRLVNSNNGATVYTTSGTNNNWSATVTLGENSNLITVTGWKQGTDVGSANVTVTKDSIAPNTTLSFLAESSVTNVAVQNVDGIVLEKNLSAIVINDSLVTAKVAMPGDNTYFSFPVTLVRGSNDVTVTVTDLAGNSSTIVRHVTLNPEIPGLTVSVPADNSFMAGVGSAPANGDAGSGFDAVNAAGAATTLNAGIWSTTSSFTVNSGFDSYQFVASGAGNTTVNAKRTIINDAGYAQLAITSPAADLATNSSSIIVSGLVASGSPTPTISIDGAAAVPVTSYVSGTGAFSHTVNFLAEGEHYVKVIADAATTAVRNIIYDSTLPSLTIQANAQNAPVAITGTIEPSAKLAAVSASLTGLPVSIPLSAVSFDPYNPLLGSVVWRANLNGYAYDTISFTSIDPAGNEKVLPFVKGVPTGDIDGDGTVRLADAMTCLRQVAGTESLTGVPRFQADVGSLVEGRVAQDGDVTVVDAVLILKKAFGLMNF